jgi:localization factor PodJL
MRGTSPADRLAASEAALGSSKPPVLPDAAGRSNFIAAARRAAQAATQPLDAHGKTPADAEAAKQSLGQRFTGKVRSLLVGASVVVLTLGAFRGAVVLIDAPETETTAPKIAQAPSQPLPAKGAQASADAFPSVLTARLTDPTPTASVAPQATVATPAAPAASSPPPDAAKAPATAAPAVAAAPAATAAAKAAEDVTGSIPSGNAANPPLPPEAPPRLDAHKPAGDTRGLVAAAAGGNAAAAYLLAEQHIDGKDADHNYDEAARLLEQASRQGLAPAQFRLGTLYEKGLGVKKARQAARKLYAAAADKGKAKAMHNLAVLYAEGIDGKPDYRVAAQWFRKAADRGVADSQYNLAVLCARGIGVTQNLSEAYKWFALAAQQGDKDSQTKRDDIAAKLDAEQLMAAKLAAKTWKAEPQPAEAVTVQAPPGGWEHPKSSAKPAPSAKRRARPHAPLQLGRM